MRTTLTLEPDVAAMLRSVQQARNLSLKEAVNAALREGLPRVAQPQLPERRVWTTPVDVGQIYLDNVDNVAEVLELLEGPGYK